MLSPFFHIFDIISLFATELEEPKIGIIIRQMVKKVKTFQDKEKIFLLLQCFQTLFFSGLYQKMTTFDAPDSNFF